MNSALWYFDTSVLVAAAVKNHVHHSRALTVLEDVTSRSHRGCTSAHTLAEVYAVLTRTSFSPPIYPSEAWQLIEENVFSNLDIIALSAKEYKDAIEQCAGNGVSGGRVYDALHLYCAQKASCRRIYTFNMKDFQALAQANIRAFVCAP